MNVCGKAVNVCGIAGSAGHVLRLSGVAAMVCVAWLAVAAQQSGDASAAVVEHVRGVVIGSVDKKPIGRALVTSGDQRLAVMTDAQGRFSFDIRHPAQSAGLGLQPNVRNGFAITNAQMMVSFLIVRKQGYMEGNFPMQISFGSETELQLKLVPEGVIRGRVTVSGGEIPAGMLVQLRHKQVQDGMAAWVQMNGAQVNSRGEFRFAELQPGDYKVMTQAWLPQRVTVQAAGAQVPVAQQAGFAPSFNGDAHDLASASPVHVGAGETVEANVNLRGTMFYRVSIPVKGIGQGATNQAATPQGVGMNVMVGDEDGAAGYSLQLNARTGMAEGFLPTGAYDVRVMSSGQPPGMGRGRIEVAGMATESMPIQVMANGTIAVHVREEYTANDAETSGRAVVMTSEGLRDLGGPRSRMVRTINLSLQSLSGFGQQGGNLGNLKSGDDPTNLTLQNVGEGRYRVVANAFGGYVASLTSDGVDLLRNPLAVGPGGVGPAIEVTIRDDGATLTGTVAGVDSGTPATPVYLIPIGAGMGRTMQPSAAFQGKFTFQNLPPGEYLVLASTPQFLQQLEYRNEEAMRGYLTKGTVVTLTAGQKATIEVPLMADKE